jgi:segregation and condensation protein A
MIVDVIFLPTVTGGQRLESVLTNACKIKIENFEGPFDLLFHLLEKNQFSIYDIPINIITDQYMEYLFTMQQLDLEIASEFLVVAATLLHIKSRMLLPEKKEKNEEENDPREELILKLVEYKKYKEFSNVLRSNEAHWEKVFYKLPEALEYQYEENALELSPEELAKVYSDMIERNKRKKNNSAIHMVQIIQHEKVSLKSKMSDVIKRLLNSSFFIFSELFSVKTKSRAEVITGFLAILELTKLKKTTLEQRKVFGEITVHKKAEVIELEDDRTAAGS